MNQLMNRFTLRSALFVGALLPFGLHFTLGTLSPVFAQTESETAAENASAKPSEATRPNIVFLITDDQGYGDLSVHGNPVLRTPNLDRLHSQSVRFTDFHVSPTCAPTRSALLTGRHEFKNGVTHTIFERERLTLDAVTLPDLLRRAGYTTGIFGKWHLGDETEYRPDRRGFDEVFIHGAGGIGQTYPGSCGDAPGNRYFDPAILHNGGFVKTQGYCTDIFFDQATRWIDGRRTSDSPFFAYISTNAPHSPYIARPEDKAIYEGKGLTSNQENFFGMIHNIDENVGKLLGKLEEWGIAENTLFVFITDNGGTAGVPVFNAGMRGSKGSPWIGGTRAASFWRWPGAFQPADRGELAAHIDFLPTIAELVGVELDEPVRRQVEGRSLVPLLRQQAAATAAEDAPANESSANAVDWADRMLVTHVGRWPQMADPETGKYGAVAVRSGRWVIVNERPAETPNWQLFDLQSDYGQQHDVAADHPEVVLELAAAFEAWWQETVPQMVNEKVVGPRINPFQEMYFAQFGGSPSELDLQKMDPSNPLGIAVPRPQQRRGQPAAQPRSQPKADPPKALDNGPQENQQDKQPESQSEAKPEAQSKPGQSETSRPNRQPNRRPANPAASAANPALPPPTLANVAYGEHPRQVLDFWQAKSDEPTPLVFVIHGGGWQGGDKDRTGRFVQVVKLLGAGISVASINYRFIAQATADGIEPPVKGPLDDAARALQFVRSKADEWNIDRERIGATGGSAGACSSLWLAFHDDQADPNSDDPVARESTRLWCVAVTGAQTTLDPQQMKEWTPNSRYGGHAFGVGGNTPAGFAEFLSKRESLLPWIERYSPYALLTADDPPVYLYYATPPALGQNQGDPTHTSNFGVKLQEKCNELGVECELVYRGAPDIRHATPTDFLIAKLKATE